MTISVLDSLWIEDLEEFVITTVLLVVTVVITEVLFVMISVVLMYTFVYGCGIGSSLEL